MAKIPFDIKWKPQIESGEYKVETRSGKTARIVCWDRIGTPLVVLVGRGEDVLTYKSNGTTGQQMQLPSDLFIITPEEDLSEFEKAVSAIFTDSQLIKRDKDGIANIHEIDGAVKRYSKRLLELAKNQLQIEGLVTMTHLNKACEAEYQSGLADGKAEALKDLPKWESDWKTSMVDKPDILDKYLCYKEHKIRISDLEKLPGFKED